MRRPRTSLFDKISIVNDIVSESNIRFIYIDEHSVTSNTNVTFRTDGYVYRKFLDLYREDTQVISMVNEFFNSDENIRSQAYVKLKAIRCAIAGVKGGETLKTLKQNDSVYRQSVIEKFRNTRTLNNKPAWNKGLTKYDHSGVLAIAQAKIDNNPMSGSAMSDDAKLHLSNVMKQKILDGTFTPNSNNRNTHWNSVYNGKTYRSSWEALFHSNNIDYEYESLRIKYIFDGRSRVYIVDFVCHVEKVAVEVKPAELLNDDNTIAKIKSLVEWCDDNDYTLILADAEWLYNNTSLQSDHKFDNRTLKKVINFYEDYKKRNNI